MHSFVFIPQGPCLELDPPRAAATLAPRTRIPKPLELIGVDLEGVGPDSVDRVRLAVDGGPQGGPDQGPGEVDRDDVEVGAGLAAGPEELEGAGPHEDLQG